MRIFVYTVKAVCISQITNIYNKMQRYVITVRPERLVY